MDVVQLDTDLNAALTILYTKKGLCVVNLYAQKTLENAVDHLRNDHFSAMIQYFADPETAEQYLRCTRA